MKWGDVLSTEYPKLHDYMKLFGLYAGKLDFTINGTKNGDYSFIFEQVIRLLLRPSEFNDSLPEPFLGVAERYAFAEPATVAHFKYNENKQFFLSDLYDSLMLYHAAQRSYAGIQAD